MMRPGRSVAAAMLLGVIQTAQSQPHACSMNELGWMAGSWSNTAQPDRAQERWALAPNGVLMGSSWEFPAGKSGFAEIMTVRPDGDSISMYLRHFDGGLSKAWEERDAPMVFKASSCDSNSVIFDGQGNHDGEHMTYRRVGDKLTILADFVHRGIPDHEEWHMIRVAD
jgi:hypothetical protein